MDASDLFSFIADLVRNWGLPWSGAAYLCIVSVILFMVLRAALYIALYISYLGVCVLRRVKVRLPAVIYAAESAIDKVRMRLRTALTISLVLAGGWTLLFLARSSLEGEQLVALEKRSTAVIEKWIGVSAKGD